MLIQTFDIRANGEDAKLVTYIRSLDHMPTPEPLPLVLILPGGAYMDVVPWEAEPIACAFNARGFHTAVLTYSVAPATFPTALMQAASAMALIKEHAAQWNVDPDRIFVSGYSAGGHLAASLGVFWNSPFLRERTGMSSEMMRPAGLVLSYPVITSGEFTHLDSIRNLLGDKFEDSSLREFVSLENRVDGDTPPTFIWSTAEDSIVPVENTLLFANALRKFGKEFELHVYPRGDHGLSLATSDTAHTPGVEDLWDIADWPDHAAMFIRRICGKNPRP